MADDAEHPLELSRETMWAMVDGAAERVIDRIATLEDQPAEDLEGAADLANRLRESPPEEPTPLDDVYDLLFDEAIPRSINTTHPGYMAYIPSGGLFHAAVAEFIANATNRYVGTGFPAPALVAIEATVIDWLCDMVGYPAGAFGLLTTGGSMANLIAVITAREEVVADRVQDAIVYTSDQSHHSVAKAARLAGIPTGNIRSIPTTGEYRIRTDALREAIASDRGTGDRPFLVVATGGTTNTGAVDDLDTVADICREEDLWYHVDAAYGGFFAMTEPGRARLVGLARCDSMTLDPHKGLCLPYGTGALLVRDPDTLARTHGVDAEYIPETDPKSGAVDFSRLGPELSRDFRGLRVWLPLKLHGLEPFREHLAEKLELAEYATTHLKGMTEVTVLAPPQLSTVAFRVDPAGVSGDALDQLNRDVMARINRRGNVHLSGTTLDGRFTIRISLLSFRTHRRHVDRCLDDLEGALGDLGIR